MLSPVLDFDPQNEVFVGDNAEAANVFLTREYRAPFRVPAIDA